MRPGTRVWALVGVFSRLDALFRHYRPTGSRAIQLPPPRLGRRRGSGLVHPMMYPVHEQRAPANRRTPSLMHPRSAAASAGVGVLLSVGSGAGISTLA